MVGPFYSGRRSPRSSRWSAGGAAVHCFIITSLGNQRMENRIAGSRSTSATAASSAPAPTSSATSASQPTTYLEPAILFAGDTTSGLAGGLGGLGGLAGGR
jgi:hypothetical protein